MSNSRTAVVVAICVALCASASQLSYINPLIGNGGDTPNGSGGMIPSVAPPFGMTRWVAQTHENYVSKTPYNVSDADMIYGFMGTHQPAIWMGESGNVAVAAGVGDLKRKFDERGLRKGPDSEDFGAALYSVDLITDDGGNVRVEMSATSRVGHLRFTFSNTSSAPYALVEASRPSKLYTVPGSGIEGHPIPYYPDGFVQISESSQEICGWNAEMQDSIIVPTSTDISGFKGHFCVRFSLPFDSFGAREDGQTESLGTELSAYAKFPAGTSSVDVRVGVSFISIEQARQNIDDEIPDGTSLEDAVKSTEQAWMEKLGRVEVEGGSEANKTVFFTAIYHALQYPYEQHESGRYYSGYDNSVHSGDSYTGYSIWDTFRAEWAFLILMAPERIPGMVQSMLQDFKEGGWLPMWKNIVETNIMVGTHADSLVAEAVLKGFREGFDLDLAWDAVWKDSVQPPVNDSEVQYFDREENVDYEVRAGLSTVYAQKGWVADEIHSESASRTLDYAYDDYAAAQLSLALGKPSNITEFLVNRAMAAPFTLFNNDTGFMEARNSDGSWAGQDRGWTEGDMWAYSFDVVHDIPSLIKFRGGNESFVKSLDEHFDGGHNDHTNEPSHHIPYLYALAGAAAKTQEKVREIASTVYNETAGGLSGNEDCGQMSAWYIFSAMGFYPVDPVSGEYVVGSPFFDKITIQLPAHPFRESDPNSKYYDAKTKSHTLTIIAPGAETKSYVRSLTVNGKSVEWPVIRHEDIAMGGELVFEMSETVQEWGGGYGRWNADAQRHEVEEETETVMVYDEL